MKLWIDNTGLQSAGQCLDGRASPHHDYDVRGLLQLATLIIYGNSINLNGFESDKIAERSKEIIEQLTSLGITPDILSISPVTETQYALACKTAADAVASDLHESFNPNEYQMLGGEPPDLPRGAYERQVAFITLAGEPDDSPRLQQAIETALMDKAVGAVEYMLACSPRLREAVAQMMYDHGHWTQSYSYQLNVFLRYHLNDALGEQSFSKYAPAVARGELIDRRHQYIIKALGKELDHIAAELRGEPLGIPSTISAILERSKGEPEAVLKVSRDFREHSGPLRNALGALADHHSADTPESRFDIHNQLRELGKQLRRNVGLANPAKLRDAVEIRLVLGIPFAFISGKELAKWVGERRQRKKTAVLTEILKASVYSDSSSYLIAKLQKLSTRKVTH